MVKSFLRQFILALVLIFGLAFACQAYQVKSVKISIMPFEHQGEGFAGLGENLPMMLAGRLAAVGGIQVVTGARDVADEDDMRRLFDRLKVDYLVAGTVLAEGDGLRIVVQLIDGEGDNKKTPIIAVAADEAGVMAAVRLLVAGISAQTMPSEPDPGPGVAIMDHNAHPDKRFFRRGGAGPLALTDLEELVDNAYSSQVLRHELQAMDAGDLNGDGTVEVVVASSTMVRVYSYNETRWLHLLAEEELPSGLVPNWLELADLDGNGQAEIYISGSDDDTPRATAMVLAGKALQTIFKHQGHYIRPLALPGSGPVLVGQPAGRDLMPEAGALFRMKVEDGSLVKGKPLALPFNLYDLTFADLDGDGREEIICLDKGLLTVAAASGERLWSADETVVGGYRYFGSAELDLDIKKPRRYIPPRIAVADLNGDGHLEIIIASNLLGGPRMMPGLRSFKGGLLQAYSWQNDNLVKLWQLPNSWGEKGLVVDLAILPEPSGRPRLYVGGELSRSWLSFLPSRSAIQIYDLK